jgi:hypothetical protein
MFQWLVFFIENIVFWSFVFVIVFMGCETPAIVFTGFGLFLFYWLFRFVFRQEGAEKFMWLNAVNMVVSIFLLYYFMTGASLQKSVRGFLNSLARNRPSLEPYLKRC